MGSIAEMIGQDEVAAIEVDDRGVITRINPAFEIQLGWNLLDLRGRPLITIIPEAMRTVHAIGFSRFLSTEKPTLLGKPLQLTVLHKDGRVIKAEHVITAEKKDGRWVFGATIRPQA